MRGQKGEWKEKEKEEKKMRGEETLLLSAFCSETCVTE